MLKIITFFGDVFPVINPNRLTWARRTVEKKVRKPDKSKVINTKPQIVIKDKISTKSKIK